MPQITGTNGDDVLTGTIGDDTMIPLLGQDQVDGGSGRDVLIVDYSSEFSTGASLEADASGGWKGSISGYPTDYVVLTGIEDIQVRAAGRSVFSVTPSPRLASDSISVTGALQTLVVSSGDAADLTFIVGSDGVARSTTGVFSGFTNYWLHLGPGSTVVTTGAGADDITGGTGRNVIDAGAGDDGITSFGVDTIQGGPGKDSLRVQLADTATPLTVGYDGSSGTISNGTTFQSIENLQVTTGAGDDHFNVAGSGAFDGGAGADTMVLDERATPVAGYVAGQFGIGPSAVDGSFGQAVFANIEHVKLLGISNNLPLYVSFNAAPAGATVDVDGGAGIAQVTFAQPDHVQFDTDASGVSHVAGSSFANIPAFYIQVLGNGGSDITTGAGSDAIAGGAGVDHLSGGAGGDQLSGQAGDDSLFGGPGDDDLTGGAGNDLLDGGAGTDTAHFGGLKSSFTIRMSGGSGSVTDTSGAEGVDTLVVVEGLSFTDVLVTNGSDLVQPIAAAMRLVLRINPAAPSSAALDQLVAPMSQPDAVKTLIGSAVSTTTVADLSYEFFTGQTPTSDGLDYLVSPSGSNLNNLNSAYYSQFNTTNRYINFASNLGKIGSGAAAFQASYGSLSLTDATAKAYASIFGAAPTAEKISHLLHDLVPDGRGGMYEREDYFVGYGLDGFSGQGTKAAMVGWLLGQAAQSDLGTYAEANDAYLADVATGKAAFGVDLVGVYAKPEYAYTGG